MHVVNFKWKEKEREREEGREREISFKLGINKKPENLIHLFIHPRSSY